MGRKQPDQPETPPADDADNQIPETEQAPADTPANEVEQHAEDGPDAIDREVDRMVQLALDADFEGRTLVGDIRDHMVEVRKSSGKPWSELLEMDQRRLAQGFEHLAQTLVRRITMVVAEADSNGLTVHATLKSYGEDGGIKIALTATSDADTVVALHSMVKQNVILRAADPTRYNAQRSEAPIERDQGDMGFESEEQPAHPADDSDLADDVPGEIGDVAGDDIDREAADGGDAEEQAEDE